MNIDPLRLVSAQINEGRQMIERALETLNNAGIATLDYNYKNNAVHLYGPNNTTKYFDNYEIEPRDSEEYPTELRGTCSGVIYFSLSEKPFPEVATQAFEKEAV